MQRADRATSAAALVLSVALSGVGGVVPAAAQDAPRDLPGDLSAIEDEREETRDQLGEVGSTLEQAMAQVADAERQLRAIEQRLGAASAALSSAREQARAIRAAADAADAQAREASGAAAKAREAADLAAAAVTAAAQELASSRVNLATSLGEEERTRRQLQDRAIGAYKHGAASEQLELMGGFLGAGDWHEVGLASAALGKVLDDDRDLVHAAEVARMAADRARARAQRAEVAAQERLAAAEHTLLAAEEAEEQAVAAAGVARARLADAEAAEAAQARAVATVQREHQQRRRVFAALESDASTAEVRQVRLEQRLAALDTAARQARRPPPPPPPPTTGAGGGNDDGRDTGDSGAPARASTPAPAPAWTARLPVACRSWAGPITTAADANGLDPRLLAALVWSESWCNPDAVSWVGAIGLAQLMPTTAAALGVDPTVPSQNLAGGARYLERQITRFGSVELGLAAYNAGPARVEEHGGIPPIPETQNYVPTVLERYAHLAG